MSQRYDSDGEKKPFPFWTLIVILACVAALLYGWKLWMDECRRYEAYQASAARVIASKDVYCDGIQVDGVDLGGKTRAEASELFSSRQSSKESDFALNVTAMGRQWRITNREVPLSFDAETVLDQAFMIGHRGTLRERLQEMDATAENGASFTTAYEYDRSAIAGLVDIIAEAVNTEPESAGLDAFDPITKTFTYKQEKSGWQLDRDKLQEDILAALDEERFDTPVKAEGAAVEPEIAVSDLKGRFGLISSFTTTTTTDRDRNTNISISAAALNGKVVQPGSTLSFNGCTGKRTGEKGYREAGAIAGGVLVDDTGGGVCQTSSTLFNAVVRADMEIVKRYAHSWPSSYVPRGEDATVNWPSRDFVFRNSSPYPIFLVAWYENRQVTVEVYGIQPDGWASIQLESKTVKTTKPSNDVLYTLDESLPLGTRQAGHSKHTGYLVDTYKVYCDAAGNEIRREKLWTTDYPATQDEILYH